MEEVHEHAKDHTVVMLVGNKCDLRHLQAIPTEEVETFAKEKKLLFAEASALDSTNVEELFQETIEKVHRVQIKKLKEELAVREKVDEPAPAKENVELNNTPIAKKCCQT
jgi:GTPase SAR1 family protein